MAHIKSLVLAVVLSMAVSVAFARPGAEKEGKHPQGNGMMKCAGEDFTKPSDMDMEMGKSCKSSNTTTADADCMAVCIGQKLGLIDATGAIDKANVAARIAASAPASKVADITTAMDTCIDQNSVSLDVTKCASYKPMITCATTAMKTICQWTAEKPT